MYFSSAFFIKKLLSLKVFGEKKDAIFTKRELFIRNLPFYSCCGGLILISLIYWYGTLFKAGEFEKKLEDGTFYYQGLAKDIESGAVDSAQLFSVNDDGKVVPGEIEFLFSGSKTTCQTCRCTMAVFPSVNGSF